MQIVGKFLRKNWDGKNPLLLGYSGGPDSKALLYMLRGASIPFHIAHVDHGWREESREEALKLEEEAKTLGVPFHTTRLEPGAGGNKEALAREERLKFFRGLFDQIPFQALLLGHHADDLAETALKRLFEGAHLPFLGGMEPASLINGMAVWRPLLKVRRKKILLYLEERGLEPIYDPTNADPAYLRSRLRLEVFPFLNRSFGKEVVENLALLSERAGELRRYLDKRVENQPVKRGEWGMAVFCDGLEGIEIRHLLQKTAQIEGLTLPRTVLDPLLGWLEERAPHRKIFFSTRWIVANRGWVFFLTGKALPEKGQVRKLTISFDATRS